MPTFQAWQQQKKITLASVYQNAQRFCIMLGRQGSFRVAQLAKDLEGSILGICRSSMARNTCKIAADHNRLQTPCPVRSCSDHEQMSSDRRLLQFERWPSDVLTDNAEMNKLESWDEQGNGLALHVGSWGARPEWQSSISGWVCAAQQMPTPSLPASGQVCIVEI